jgi:predicted TPR repeat methyltransferase
MYDPGPQWDDRAKLHGRRSVIDLGLNHKEVEDLTHLQNDILLPILDGLIQKPGMALDFGCGCGRFLPQLEFRCDHLFAYDPSPEMIRLAKEHGSVLNDTITFASGPPKEFLTQMDADYRNSLAFIWCALVFGCIPDNELSWIAADLCRLLPVGGVLLFADHTSETQRGSDFWRWRKEEEYLKFFPDIDLKRVANYTTRGNNIGVFAGRRVR